MSQNLRHDTSMAMSACQARMGCKCHPDGTDVEHVLGNTHGLCVQVANMYEQHVWFIMTVKMCAWRSTVWNCMCPHAILIISASLTPRHTLIRLWWHALEVWDICFATTRTICIVNDGRAGMIQFKNAFIHSTTWDSVVHRNRHGITLNYVV